MSYFALGIISLITLFLAYRWGLFRLPLVPSFGRIPFYKVALSIITYLIAHVLPVVILLILLNFQKVVFFGEGWQGGFYFFILLFVFFAVGGYFWKQTSAFKRFILFEGDPSNAFSKKALRPFGIGILTLLVALPVTAIVKEALADFDSYMWNIPSPQQAMVEILIALRSMPILFYTLIFGVIFLGPIVEELVFRGFIQTWIRGRFGRPLGVWITAILFTAFHFESKQGLGNIETLGALFILALFLGLLREKTQSLYGSIGLHCAFNAYSALAVAIL